ncbi:unnamed protein product [Rhodiola kirilowii]
MQGGNEEPDYSSHVFFKLNELKIGQTLPIYFPKKDHKTLPKFLPKEDSDTIPFSSTRIKFLLNLFQISPTSPQAKAVKATLVHCEAPPMIGESKFCATSLESLLIFVTTEFKPNNNFKVMTTTHVKKSKTHFQNYTINESPEEIVAPQIVSCHTMPYPYAVYYCHSLKNDNKVFEVSLLGENGDLVKAVGVCHLDTSQWNIDHVSFKVLGIKPGQGPVCHFVQDDNLVWIPKQDSI